MTGEDDRDSCLVLRLRVTLYGASHWPSEVNTQLNSLAAYRYLNVEDGVATAQLLKPRASAHYTVIFNTLVMMLTCNLFNQRRPSSKVSKTQEELFSLSVDIVVAVGLGAQVLVVNYGGHVFGCVALSPTQWAYTAAAGVGIVPWQRLLELAWVTQVEGGGILGELTVMGGIAPHWGSENNQRPFGTL